MQLPQLYRRGVVRPLDDCAAKQLAAFKIESPIRVEWLQLMGDDHFALIWESGLFQRINDSCGIEISDYEEVELEASKVAAALNAVQATHVTNCSASAFIERLEGLLYDAITSSRSVYFVF